MQVEAFLATREEPMQPGFCFWAGLIYVDQKMLWADCRCIGQGPQVSFPQAQLTGALEILRRLVTVWQRQPDESWLRFVTDSKQLIDELRGDCAPQRAPTQACQVLLNEAIELSRWLEPAIKLRYCRRRDNAVAHAIIDKVCAKHHVPVRATIQAHLDDLKNNRRTL
jgi:hypothetical protein